MNKQKTTKKALLASLLSLMLCCVMLIGTTFAWFTDSVTSGNNKIQAGNLEVSMTWAEGKLNPEDEATAWEDASNVAIFNYDLWEPGYTVARHIKIANEGTLALKYQLSIVANGEVSNLTDVIDVYYADPAVQVSGRDALTEMTKLGTLTKVLEDFDTTAAGNLAAEEEDVVTIVLKMQETAGNEYQNLSVGSSFAIQLTATQDTVESDSFDEQYDAAAPKMIAVNSTEYGTVEAAFEAAKDGDTVIISGETNLAPITVDKAITLKLANITLNASEGNALTVNNADAKIVIEDGVVLVGAKGSSGIYVAENAKLDLSGTGSLVAKGNAGVEGEYSKSTTDGGSGIGGKGTILIHNLSNLVAEGYGKDGFGIGGATSEITIKDTTITNVRGGFANPAMEFNHYGKDEPEGGAAIGSNVDKAVITLENVTVVNAEGGSKAAGIGGSFWTGVTVKIKDSNIKVIGGNSSAGIGGSRVESGATADNAVTISIEDSKINATGGQFAAGIGSGYDTHCNGKTDISKAPLTSITIDGASEITAQGGWLGAGIGTGHNVVNLELNIPSGFDSTNVKAGSSEDPSWCCWGMKCTTAENVGYGVINAEHFASVLSGLE